MSYSTSSWTHVLCRGASVITMLLACLSAGAGDARPRTTYSDGGSQVTDAITGLTGVAAAWGRCGMKVLAKAVQNSSHIRIFMQSSGAYEAGVCRL